MKTVWIAILTITISLAKANVDTAIIYSIAMKKNIKTVVIKPENYKKSKQNFPVVYVLHGYSGNFSNWIVKVPQLQKLATLHQILIVCPDGGFSSWYFDSPIDSTYKYETHVAKEVVSFIDSVYKTIPNRSARAITGLSMGGHGGLFLGFRHADIYGACGSMSGGVDLTYSRNKFDVSKRIGDTINYAQNWKNYSVINLIEQKPLYDLSIIIDCGTEDFFYNNNKDLHQKMMALKIKHDYIERPGKHDWNYWTNAIEYQLYFFKKFFEEKLKKG